MNTGETPVNVPTTIPFGNIPPGGVFTTDLVSWWLKGGPTTAADLADGHTNSGYTATDPVYYFPGATLVIQ